MERREFDFGLKTIVIPPRNEYKKLLISSTEKFLTNLRWRVAYFKKPWPKPKSINYKLKSDRTPPKDNDLDAFENDLYKMIQNLSFGSNRNPLNNKIKNALREIHSSDKVCVTMENGGKSMVPQNIKVKPAIVSK